MMGILERTFTTTGTRIIVVIIVFALLLLNMSAVFRRRAVYKHKSAAIIQFLPNYRENNTWYSWTIVKGIDSSEPANDLPNTTSGSLPSTLPVVDGQPAKVLQNDVSQFVTTDSTSPSASTIMHRSTSEPKTVSTNSSHPDKNGGDVKPVSGPSVPANKSHISVHSESGFHIIVFLSIFNGKVWPNYESFTESERRDRDTEVIEALAFNLNNTMVERVHLLYMNQHELEAVMNLKLYNMEKIIPVNLTRRIHMADFFLYASRNLVDRPVIATNSDIVIGEGFDKIDTTKMRDNRIIFSLTRYADVKHRCKKPLGAICEKGKYWSSHDTHIFRLAEPLDEKVILSRLDYPTNMWGAESGMMYVMQTDLKFKVHNPCRILKTHHQHCSKVHGPKNDGKHYTLVNNATLNFTSDMIFKSGYGMADIEDHLNYTNPLYNKTTAKLPNQAKATSTNTKNPVVIPDGRKSKSQG